MVQRRQAPNPDDQVNFGFSDPDRNDFVPSRAHGARRKPHASERDLSTRPHTRLKLDSLAVYLPQWFGIASNVSTDTHYIDAFAGEPGIPLQLLDLDQGVRAELLDSLGQAWGLPVAVTGHFHDERAKACPSSSAQACDQQFVVTAVDWRGEAARVTPTDLSAVGGQRVTIANDLTLLMPTDWEAEVATSEAVLYPASHRDWRVTIRPAATQRYDQTDGLSPGYTASRYVLFDYSKGYVIWTSEEGWGPSDRVTRTGVNVGGQTYEVTLDWSAVSPEAIGSVSTSYRDIVATIEATRPDDPAPTGADVESSR